MASIERQDEFIRSLGVEAYRVGGSVRDEILGRTPKDADYIVRGVSLARLADCIVLADRREKPKPLKNRQGQQFGWRTARSGIEISLPRKEANAGHGRKQIIEVDPNLSLAEDAKRRDFTFNALYKEIVVGPTDIRDPTGTGIDDLMHRIIRTTHQDSFRDDPLRMLRALRFASTLDADIEPFTMLQMRMFADHAGELTHKGFTSGTVFDELSKLLMGQQPGKALRIAAEHGVLAAAMPELSAMIGFEQGSRYHDLTTDEHTFVALDTAAKVNAPLRVRWALLFHDAGKPDAAWTDEKAYKHYYASPTPHPYTWPDGSQTMERTEDHEVVGERLWRAAAKRMNVERRFTEDVATLVREHMITLSTSANRMWTKIARARVKLGDDLLRDLLLMRTCDLSGKGSNKISQEQIKLIGQAEYLRHSMESVGVPISVRNLEIDGHDVRAIGVKDKNIGLLLREVLDEVVCDPTPMKRSRDWQLSAAGRLSVGL